MSGESNVWPGLSRFAEQGGVCKLNDLTTPFSRGTTRIVNRDTGELVAVVFYGPDHNLACDLLHGLYAANGHWDPKTGKVTPIVVSDGTRRMKRGR